SVLAARDPLDPATERLRRLDLDLIAKVRAGGADSLHAFLTDSTSVLHGDYTAWLDKDGLKGARIGVPGAPTHPANDAYMGRLPARSVAVMAQAIGVLQDAGATIVRANMPTAGWIGGPGTAMGVLNTNPLSRGKGNVSTPPIVFLYELKHDLNLY